MAILESLNVIAVCDGCGERTQYTFEAEWGGLFTKRTIAPKGWRWVSDDDWTKRAGRTTPVRRMPLLICPKCNEDYPAIVELRGDAK